MKRRPSTRKKPITEIEQLRLRLEEAEETLEAIRKGEVDALVVSGPQGDQIYTLKGADRHYRVLLENMNEGAVTMTRDGTIVYCNNRFAEMIKTPSSEVINSSIYEVFSAADKRVVKGVLRTNGKSEVYVKATDGTAMPVYLSCTSVELDGTPSLCMVITDLTEQKRNEENKAVQTLYRPLFDDLNQGAVIFGFVSSRYGFKNGVIIYSNRRFAELVKRPVSRVVNSSIFDFMQGEDAQIIRAILADLRHGGQGQREIRLKRDDGELVDVNFSIGSTSRKAITFAIVTELTEIKKREQEAKRLASELLTAQEKERKRIAGELHDGMAANLSAIKMALQSKLNSIMNNTPTEIRLEDLIDRLQGNIEEVRRIMNSLHPSILDDLGIIAAINWHCREYQKTYPHIQVKPQIEVPESEMSIALKTAIFRICQESLNNVAKHSRANLVTLSLTENNQKIELAVKDNGEGFDLNEASRGKEGVKGLGLGSMKERAEILGGFFQIVSSPETGTTVSASWPTIPEK